MAKGPQAEALEINGLGAHESSSVPQLTQLGVDHG